MQTLEQIKSLLELEVLSGNEEVYLGENPPSLLSRGVSGQSSQGASIQGSQEVLVQASKESVSVQDKIKQMEIIKQQVLICKKCSLSISRKNIVLGEGSINADLMFIGEAPGYDEDITGRPFVGKDGQLLTKMINAMKFKREDVYIANILKCRPPGNRNPQINEIELCIDYLYKQIEIIKPKIICTLGGFASKTLLNTEQGITRLRGKVYKYKGIDLIPTFHPSYLLRNEEMKKYAWQDLQTVMSKM